MKNDPNDENNIIRMNYSFLFRNHYCFSFELLHKDLYEYLKERKFYGFSIEKIKNYTK